MMFIARFYFMTKYNQFTQIEQTQQLLLMGLKNSLVSLDVVKDFMPVVARSFAIAQDDKRGFFSDGR